MNLGDFDTGKTIYHKFTTFRPSTGAPFTLAGSPAISVYKDGSTTQSTTGVTLTTDFDSVTGLNHAAIDTSADGTFYAAGSFFDIVITTGTVDSVSAVGTVVGRFTLQANSALKPVTAGRKLAVDSNNRVDLGMWLGSTPNALVSGRVDSYAGAIASSVIAASSFAANALDAVWSTATRTITGGTITTYTGNTPQTGDAFARLGAPAGVSVSADIAAINAKTTNLPASPAAVGSNMGTVTTVTGNVAGNLLGTLSSTERIAIADALLNRDIAVARSLPPSSRTVVQALDALRNKWSISGTTITYCQPDDSATSWQSVLGTTDAADPVTSSDPI